MVDNVVAYTAVTDLISQYEPVSGRRDSRRQYHAYTHDVEERAWRPLPYPYAPGWSAADKLADLFGSPLRGSPRRVPVHCGSDSNGL